LGNKIPGPIRSGKIESTNIPGKLGEVDTDHKEEPRNLAEVLSRPDKEKRLEAMRDELASIEQHQTWELEKPQGCRL